MLSEYKYVNQKRKITSTIQLDFKTNIPVLCSCMERKPFFARHNMIREVTPVKKHII